MKLTLIRHGEVTHPYQGRYNGHNNIPLSPRGLQDAKIVGKRLAKYHFDAIYCSDLPRAKQTLQALDLHHPTIFTEQLREKSWGEHEGMSFEQIEASGIKYTTFLEWIEQLGGERIEDFQARVANFFYNYLPQQNHQSVLIVTHAGVIKTLLALQKNLTLEESFALKLEYGEMINLTL
ncbi:MAG: histidine phosphatase family protein [Epsilonproteobacteria bacterium]|nr:histidine phosphatase family protein [Campylobacterota bacterium]